jgi:hypothetical protein
LFGLVAKPPKKTLKRATKKALEAKSNGFSAASPILLTLRRDPELFKIHNRFLKASFGLNLEAVPVEKTFLPICRNTATFVMT